MLPKIKLYYITTVIKAMVLNGKKQAPRDKTTHIWTTNLWKKQLRVYKEESLSDKSDRDPWEPHANE